VKREWVLLEDFDRDAQLAQRQEQFDGDIRRRRVVLNGVVIVGVSLAPQVALKMGTAGDQRWPDFVDADERAADAGGVTRQLLDVHCARTVREARVLIERAGRGDCGACRQRQEPQQHDACLDDVTRNRDPQPKVTISQVQGAINGSASL